MIISVRNLFVMGLMMASFGWNQAQSSANDLTIGSAAPRLDVEHWVQNGKGKFKPVTTFEVGKVYVVEFWATWCGPCRASMPHLAELQDKFASKGVQIISISDEDLDTVQEFLKQKVPAQKGAKPEEKAASKTYADITSAYCLTTDPDGTSNKDYLEAASQNGIPAAFIVGKDRKIEWIGHPMEMDEPLQKVVDGSWKREEFAAVFKEKQDIDKGMVAFSQLMQRGKSEEGLALLSSLIAKVKDEQMKGQLLSIRFQVILQEKKLASKLPEAVKEGLASAKSNPELVNEIAWLLYEAHMQGQVQDTSLLKLALTESEAAVQKVSADVKAAMLDTVAHLQHALGDKKKALATQKAAFELAQGEEKASIKEFIDQLNDELKEEKK